MEFTNRELLYINYALKEHLNDIKNSKYPDIDAAREEYVKLILRFTDEVNEKVFGMNNNNT